MKTATNVLCAAMILLAVPACSPAAPTPQTVVLVVVDTLRPDHLGTYGHARPTSPNIDAFAAESAVFERAYSTSTWTLPSFGSMFTGQIPVRHGAGLMIRAYDLRESGAETLVEHGDKQFAQLDQNLPTLARTLQMNDFITIGVVNNAFLNPVFGLSKGFSVYDYDEEARERGAG